MKRISFLLVLCSLSSFAQDRKEADAMFEYGNYEDALDSYLQLLEESTEDADLNYRIGVCYLNSNIDKSLAIPYLENIKDDPKANPNTMYLLGRAYHYGYEFEKAIEALNKFAVTGEGNDQNLASVPKYIDYCQNAIEWMKFPLNVDITNVGEGVNSPYPDYFPFIPKDESYLLFNSRRDRGELLPNGAYTSDIYISVVQDGKFSSAKPIGDHINTVEGNEEIVGLTSDGNRAVMYFEDINGNGDLYICSIENMKLGEPQKLPKVVNSKYREIAASISLDGKQIYFASDIPGGYGGTDLYVSRILPNGKWGPAQNLGPNINTEYDEDFPNISPDGKTLFFSSKGHTGMGGYDIFRATWDPTKRVFNTIENMRFPINTPDDDMNFMLSESGRYGYISSLRGDGHGDIDIYRVQFNEVEPRYTLITGKVLNGEGESIPADDVYLAAIDMDRDEVYGDYKPNPNTGRFVMILPPGKYEITLEVAGYEMYFEQIEILDKSSFKPSLTKDLILTKE